MKKLLLILGFSSLLAGCYYDNEEKLYPVKPVSPADTLPVSYAATIQPMIASNCAIPGCHVTNGTSPNLTAHSVVSTNKDRVKARAVDGENGGMPASGLMSTENRDKLKRWIEAGAINN